MEQLTFRMASLPTYQPDDFVAFPANAAAVAAIEQWPQWQLGTLWVRGSQGSGKTHLAHVWAARSHATWIAAERMIQGWAPAEILGHPNRAWVVDDVEKVPNEAALFHVLNAVRESGGTLLLTSILVPAQLSWQLADLCSRVKAVSYAELGDPDEAALRTLMFKLFSDKQLRMPEEVVEYLLPRMERSYAAVHFWVETLDALALKERRKITIPMVRQIVEGLAKQQATLL